jgi:hypothetical protein
VECRASSEARHLADLIDGGLGEIWRRGAAYVDKICKGAKPADLSVEQPTKFEFLINLKSARGLGLEVPPSLPIRAHWDEGGATSALARNRHTGAVAACLLSRH